MPSPVYYEELRRRWIPSPSRLQLILVGESPPASGKYFYDTKGEASEPLFRAIMDSLMGISPNTKEEGLAAFKAAGYLLLDATYEPINDKPPKERNAILKRDAAELMQYLFYSCPKRRPPIVLIKRNVCQILEPILMDAGLNVSNQGRVVQFPTHGNQPKFKASFAAVLENAKEAPPWRRGDQSNLLHWCGSAFENLQKAQVNLDKRNPGPIVPHLEDALNWGTCAWLIYHDLPQKSFGFTDSWTDDRFTFAEVGPKDLGKRLLSISSELFFLNPLEMHLETDLVPPPDTSSERWWDKVTKANHEVKFLVESMLRSVPAYQRAVWKQKDWERRLAEMEREGIDEEQELRNFEEWINKRSKP
jgi:hypothetical protein